jgi:hypothetical protein
MKIALIITIGVLILFLFCPFSVKADPEQGQLTYLKSGTLTTYDGFLADQKQMDYFRYKNEKLKLTEQKVVVLEELNVALEKRGNEYKSKFETAQDDLAWANTKAVVYGVGGIAIGAGLTIGIIKILGR